MRHPAPAPHIPRSSSRALRGFWLLPLPLLAAAAALPAQPAVGTIQGTVRLSERPARRTVDRYGGPGGASARPLQHVPIVAYLEGVVGVARREAIRDAEVAQRDTAFVPPVLVVPVGTPVAFPNRDGFFHNVISFSPAKRFDLGRYPRGESKTVVFDKPGVAKVYCEVHQFMRAAVIVVENPHHAIVGADGTFTISGVPAGTHRLVVWDVERRPRHVDVTVTPGGVIAIDVSLP